MKDPLFLPAYQLARMIREGDASAVEVLEAHLAHIAHHNSRVNAIVTLDEAGARQRAAAADRALADGQLWGPLHGVPITLEDAHATAHIRSTWGGLPSLAHNVPSEDGTVAARLKAAGAIVMGKTHGPDIWGAESIFEPANNPYDLERTPGGSSAGPAAAVAAGLTPLDIGLDTLGSILNPAHYSGICGMRPTEHRVPVTGVLFIDAIRKFRIMSVAGPMARSVGDLRLALQISAGPDGLDNHVPPLPWKAAVQSDLRRIRIAWTPSFADVLMDNEIRAAIEGLAGELDQRGAQIERVQPEVNFTAQDQLSERLFGLLAGTFAPRPESTPPAALEDYLAALHERDSYILAWEQFFADWDVFLCPAGPIAAERHADTDLVVNGSAVTAEQKRLLGIPFALSPISGCPSVVIPLGMTKSGLPFGVQLMGRRWQDERLLAIAEAISEVTAGFQRPPGY